MLNIAEVPKSAFSEIDHKVLSLIYDYTTKLKKVSPVTPEWIPISQHLCLAEITGVSDGLISRSLAELDSEGYIETTKFNHSCPECRCKWFRLTDKFYQLLKGK